MGAVRIEDALCHVGVGRVDAAPPHEPPERIDRGVAGRMTPRDAVAGQDDWRLRLLDELQGAGDRLVLRSWIGRPPHFERLHVDVLRRDVLRDLDVRRAGLLQARKPESLSHHLGCGFGDCDPGAPFRDRPEHADDVEILVRFLVGALKPRLPGDRDEGSAVEMGIRDAR